VHQAPPDLLQRATGLVRLDVGDRASRSRIVSLRQQGCLKLLFPRVADGAALEAVTVNTSGGIAAGDRVDSRIACGAGTRLSLTAQAAERCYRARPGEAPAEVKVELRLDADARLEWLPQETILFDGARLRRRLEVDMAADAHFLALESRVFGRALHGERMRQLDLSDRVAVRHDGRPVLVDALELHGDAEAALSRRAVGAGAIASAMLVLVAPGAEALLQPVRDLLTRDAGASAWDGMLLVRLVSRDAGQHRALITAVLSVLRGGRPLPPVWRC
jgi:urease accessory protein